MTKILLSLFFIISLYAMSFDAFAQGRTGSKRVGGYTSSGKGSHYIGGYTAKGGSYTSRSSKKR